MHTIKDLRSKKSLSTRVNKFVRTPDASSPDEDNDKKDSLPISRGRRLPSNQPKTVNYQGEFFPPSYGPTATLEYPSSPRIRSTMIYRWPNLLPAMPLFFGAHPFSFGTSRTYQPFDSFDLLGYSVYLVVSARVAHHCTFRDTMC